MFGLRKTAKRFSLLLLEEGEDYVADWVAACKWPPGVPGNWQGADSIPGKLRLATRSLFFEPDDVRIPVVRLPFSHVQTLEPAGRNAFVVATTVIMRMRANAADAPYAVDKGRVSTWRLTLPYSSLDSFMPMAQEQLAAGRLPAQDRDEHFQAAEQRRVDGCSFDSSRLSDFAERVLFDGAAAQLAPLVRDAGRLVVTDARLYFQPLHNVSGDNPVRSHPLALVAAVARRSSSLRPIGLEVFMVDARSAGAAAGSGGAGGGMAGSRGGGGGGGGGGGWDAPSAFFAFRSNAERDKCLEVLLAQPALGSGLPGGHARLQAAAGLLEGASGWMARVTSGWQRGAVSNFEYLLFVNLASGRSFNDLSQWPIFPWVLADYTSERLDLNDPSSFRDLSKPMGALNERRLSHLRQRYLDMPDDHPRFLYGTHYSCPGYVMYWLVRAAPAHMLRLQNGKFDAPDRLFCSVADAWAGATSHNPTDVKELTPEFYLPSPAFLVNRDNLALGTRQSGRPVGDVELPPWASGPVDFLSKMRAALESPYVSANLHHWIDLIFGYKQRGEAAIRADNVFHPLTYSGGVDLDKLTDRVERAAVEAQVNEFGQCPRQIFGVPHPPRLVCPPPPEPGTVFQQQGVGSGGAAMEGTVSASGGASAAAANTGGGGGGGATLNPNPIDDSDGRSLSLTLLAAITAAAESSGPQEQLPPQAPEVLRKLDSLSCCDGAQPSSPAWYQPVIEPQRSSTSPSPSPSAAMATTLPQQPSSIGNGAGGGTAGGGTPLPPPGGTLLPSPLGSSRRDALQAGAAGMLRHAGSRLQGLGSWSSRRLGELGGSIAEAVRTGPTAHMKGASDYGERSYGSSMGAAASAASAMGPDGSQAADALGLSPASPGLSPASSSGSLPPPSELHGAAAAAAASGAAAAASGAALDVAGGGVGGRRPQRHPSSKEPLHRQRHEVWPSTLRGDLSSGLPIAAMHDRINGVALGPAAGGSCYCVGDGAALKVFSLAPGGTQVRAAKLGSVPLSCVALLPTLAPSAAAAASAGGGHHQQQHQEQQHPTVLAGSYDNRVYAYSPDHGRLLGSFPAHDDAVSCMLLLPPPGTSSALGPGSFGCSDSGVGGDLSAGLGLLPQRLVTGSWDCSVRVWRLDEGRSLWSGAPVVAEAELEDQSNGGGGGGVWCVAGVGPQLLAAGTEEGVVSIWDLRQQGQRAAWQACVSQDYIGGLALTPDERHLVAAGGDGHLRLLDIRAAASTGSGGRAGDGVRSSGIGSGADPTVQAVQAGAGPLRCVQTDGAMAAAGAEGGQVVFWQLPLPASSGARPRSPSVPGPDPSTGLFPPLLPSDLLQVMSSSSLASSSGQQRLRRSASSGGEASAVNALALARLPSAMASGGEPEWVLATGREDGRLGVFRQQLGANLMMMYADDDDDGGDFYGL